MMKRITCGEIAGACNGVFHGAEADKEKIVAGIALVSLKIVIDWFCV